MKTGISKKWSEVAQSWLGIKSGRHCHWCKNAKSEDGELWCGKGKYKSERIRTWDGEYCAKSCKLFELSPFYKTDVTFNKMFKDKK